MKRPQIILITVVIFIALVAFVSSAFIVNETEQVIITQFGRPVGEAIVIPGIHFKIPIIQALHIFDKRFLEWDGDPNEVPTRDKRYIWVDTYARWRIADPLLFFQRVRDEIGAQSRLDDILDGEVRNAIARQALLELVRSTNREPQITEDMTADEQAETFLQIESGRGEITRSILEVASLRTAELGIELLDMQFKRINYVEEVRNKIFDRMISERQRIAERFRSEGQGEASKILGDRERDLKEIQSGAYKIAQEIIGKADAEAAAIYAKAYNQNSEAREFYQFVKTMETYESVLSEKDWLILSTKGDFFKYIQSQSGQ